MGLQRHQSADTGESDAVSRVADSVSTPPRLRGPGSRPHRVKRALAVYEDFVRQENPDLDDDAVRVRAQQLLDELKSTHPHAAHEFERTAPTSRAPSRRGLHEKIELAAIRSLPQAQRLEDLLRHCRHGRPAARSLPLAIFECNAWAKGAPEVRCYYNDFFGSDRLLDWAHGYPLGAGGQGKRSESTVYSTLEAMLERHEPEACVALNLDAIKELAKKHPDIGRYVAVDGTSFTAPVEQRAAFSESEEQLLRRGMSARVHHHGAGKTWRGWVLLQLIDIKSTLPLIWAVLPLDVGREFLGVTLLIDSLLDHWPDCPIEYLVGDMEYDVEELAHELEFRYGIHPVFGIRGGGVGGAYQWTQTDGVPECAQHGLMKLKWSQDFFEAKHRLQDGARGGELDAKDVKARLRWTCRETGCPASAATYPKRNARLYTYLPHRGNHKRTGLRIALLRRRNAVESVIGELKRRGIGLGGQQQPRWVSSDRQAEWLAGAALLGQTLRRLAHESGAYAEAEAEAVARSLVKDGAIGSRAS